MKTDGTGIDPTLTVNDVIARDPETLGVFTTFGIDACCGGAKTVEEAARRHGIDLDALLAALQRREESGE